ncbi:hypothetical protein GCM10018793_27790 [Streptomyces sulfonofaciens]|uniref:Uncharacterized protein n=1 Tax=Streptomyces sulfonofaciens TaxID=68272 RepID=A0A919G5M5_9ACTN|nr:hypothetical protein [Streptomyces sulfonofaciens]GHH78124.1 hypothetical protein GCM10018793_27790 [Streptomyces sulfonofaciens]
MADGTPPQDGTPRPPTDGPGEPTDGAEQRAHGPAEPAGALSAAGEARRRADERHTERQMWWYLAYFLFGIHLVALVMIFAVRHGG